MRFRIFSNGVSKLAKYEKGRSPIKLKKEKRGRTRTDRLECSLLTSDLNRGRLPSNLTWSRPCHALALEPLPTEVLLDLIPRHVQLDLDDPCSGTRVDKILVLRSFSPVTVTAKIHLQCSGIRWLVIGGA